MGNLKHVRASVSAIAATLTLLSGCSSEQRVEYDYPEELCGVRISQDLIKPFFLPGSKLRESGPGLDNSLLS